MSVSPGGLGGLRGLIHVCPILENIGVLVIPDQMAISRAHEVFNQVVNSKTNHKKGKSKRSVLMLQIAQKNKHLKYFDKIIILPHNEI
jgi:hypothetical protein